MNDDLFKKKYRIPSTRLKGWDYSKDGYYFVTICIKNKSCLLGCVKNGEIILSDIGNIVNQCWLEIPLHFSFVQLDEFIIMPNHIHGIIVIDKSDNNVETQNVASLQSWNINKFGPQSNNLASIIRGFKVGVKKWTTRNNLDFNWQSRYYERIIRDENELMKIRNYIRNNPMDWLEDEENPDFKK